MASQKWQINRPTWPQWRRSLGFYLTLFSLTVVLCLAVAGLQRVMAQSIVCSTKQSCLEKTERAISNTNYSEALKFLKTLQNSDLQNQLDPREKWWVSQTTADIYIEWNQLENARENLKVADRFAQTQPERSAVSYSLGLIAAKETAVKSRIEPSLILKEQFLPQQALQEQVLTTVVQFEESIKALVPSEGLPLSARSPIPSLEVLQPKLQQLRQIATYQSQGYKLLADAYQDLAIAVKKYNQPNRALDPVLERSISDRLKPAETLRQSVLPLTQALLDLLPNIQTAFKELPPDRPALEARLHFVHTLGKLKGFAESVNQADLALKNILSESPKLPAQSPLTLALKSLPKTLLPKDLQDKLSGAAKTADIMAEDLLEQTIPIAQSQNYQAIEAQARIKLARLYRAADKTDQADALMTAEIIQRLDQQVPPELSGQLYGDYARSLKNKQSDAEALTASELAIARIESVRGDLVALADEDQYNYRDSIEIFYRDNIDLHLKQNSDKPSQDALKTVLYRVEALQLAEIHNYFREPCIIGKSILLDEFIQKGATDAALIYPIVLEDQIHIIAKLPDKQELQHYEPSVKVSREQVRKAVENFPEWLRKNNTDEVKKSQIYDWLIKPLEPDLKLAQTGQLKQNSKSDQPLESPYTLVFVLDSELRNVPMAALYDGKQYLIQKAPIALSPGLRLFKPEPMQRREALFGGLVKEVPQRFGADELGSTLDELEKLRALRVVKGQLSTVLASDQCDRQAGNEPLLENCFTSKNLSKSLSQTRFNILHLSTHAVFSSEVDKTYILMADEPNGKVSVNQFSAAIKQRERLREEPIELLFLSACETVKNDNRSLLGLAGIALRSGARSTIATLIQVPDATTPDFVDKFYRYLNQNETKAKALQLAQKAMINDSALSAWAPYVLVGSWR
jgi:CHAT domain-containing protein